MTPFINFTQYQSEALVICLGASFVWAGLLYFGARALGKTGPAAETLWIGALILAVLPSLIAPLLAAFGLSLRPAPLPAPAMIYVPVEMAAPVVTAPIVEAAPAPVVTAEQMVAATAIIYIYGALMALALWLIQLVGFSFAVSRAIPVRDPQLLADVERWAARLGVENSPQIKRSRHVSSVCIFGAVRPVIVIPDDIQLKMSHTDIVMMCAHELAHVRRGDTRLFTATALTRVLFWFNPLVKRIAANAELAAEEGADALVLKAGVDRRAYATCFVEGLKFAAAKQNAQPALTPSFTPADRSGRRRRLNAILAGGIAPRASMPAKLVLASAASAAALLAVGQAALAVNPHAGERADTLENGASDDLDLARLEMTLSTLNEKAASTAPVTPAANGEDETARPALNVTPVDGKISSKFGVTRVIDGKTTPVHRGIDIKAAKGTPVAAAGDGVIVDATGRYQDMPAWGNVVVIDHGHGVVTRYFHLDSYAVKRGDRVKAGDIIGAVGETGRATGPHLHFETLRNGDAVDPAATVLSVTAPAAPAPAPAPATTPKPESAVTPVTPPTPVTAQTPATPPKPLRSLKFAMNGDFPGDVTINGVAIAASDAPREFFALGADNFANGIFDGLEDSLLGGEKGKATYHLSFTDGEDTFSVSSDEPMTAEQKKKLKKELAKMRQKLERASAERERAHEEAARQREAHLERMHEEIARVDADAVAERANAASRRAEAAIARAEKQRARDIAREIKRVEREVARAEREAGFDVVWAGDDGAYSVEWSGDSADDIALEMLDTQEEAIVEARDSLDETVDGAIDDALADLADAEADLDDEDLTPVERAEAKRSIAEARRSLEKRGEAHQREVKRARRSLDDQQADIVRQRKELLRKSQAGSKD
ncbi:MAG: peptidoglycan DD-metalloendopeptidase family protein [Parvularculaceae bacterium]